MSMTTEERVAAAERQLRQEVARLRRSGAWRGRALRLGEHVPDGLDELAQLILHELGFECSYADDLPPGHDGLTRPWDGKVYVRDGVPPERQAHAWAHELGHALLQHGPTGHTLDGCDVEAEHYAFLVLQPAGLDAIGCSPPYICARGSVKRWRRDETRSSSSLATPSTNTSATGPGEPVECQHEQDIQLTDEHR